MTHTLTHTGKNPGGNSGGIPLDTTRMGTKKAQIVPDSTAWTHLSVLVRMRSAVQIWIAAPVKPPETMCFLGVFLFGLSQLPCGDRMEIPHRSPYTVIYPPFSASYGKRPRAHTQLDTRPHPKPFPHSPPKKAPGTPLGPFLHVRPDWRLENGWQDESMVGFKRGLEAFGEVELKRGSRARMLYCWATKLCWCMEKPVPAPALQHKPLGGVGPCP